MVKWVSMKQWVELELTRAWKEWLEMVLEMSRTVKELDERTDVLSLTSLVARRGSMQSSTYVEGGLLSIFLSPWLVWHWISCQSWQLGPWPLTRRMRTSDVHVLCDYLCHRRSRGCCPFVTVILVRSACHPFQLLKRGGACCCCCQRSSWVVVQSCWRTWRCCFWSWRCSCWSWSCLCSSQSVFPVVHLAVGLHGFVGFVRFTGTSSIFMSDLGVIFPIAGVNIFDEGTNSVEVVQLADPCNFILDVAGKSLIELLAEGSVTPIDFGGELLKANNVFSNFLVIMYFEVFKLIFSIGFNVVQAEVGVEFGDEFGIVVGPSGVAVQVHE